MEKDYSELIEYLDKKFENTTSKEDLSKLTLKLISFEEFDQFKREMQREFISLKETINSLTVSIDNLSKAVDILAKEYIAVTSKIDRHEKWFHQVADKLGIKLEY